MKNIKLLPALAIFFAVNTSATFAESLSFKSTAQQTQLIELFSSEGCSSCPPADEWISGLQSRPGLWKDFVPVVFHVDYWDRLGWRDPFASEEFSERQQRYAQSWGSSSIYTPGLVLSGREWRNWSGAGKLPASTETPGVLQLDVLGENRYRLMFEPASGSPGEFEIHVALLGMGIESQVLNGENYGRTLRHDFTALAYRKAEEKGKSVSHTFELKPRDLPDALKPKSLAVAGWVTRKNKPVPIQTVGGSL